VTDTFEKYKMGCTRIGTVDKRGRGNVIVKSEGMIRVL